MFHFGTDCGGGAVQQIAAQDRLAAAGGEVVEDRHLVPGVADLPASGAMEHSISL